MPKDFDMCVKEGGRVRTMMLGKNKDMTAHVCYDKNNKAHMGLIKSRKKK